MDRHAHWEHVYQTKGDRDVSWHEDVPDLSLQLLDAAGLTSATCVVDIGGGNSRLIDALIARGLSCLAVLDISESAIARARARLGAAAAIPTWVCADVTGAWTLGPVDIWHDRAVFHFLTTADDRAAYVSHLRRILKPQGTAIIATFAIDGPARCSGLPVARYSPETLGAELGDDFDLVEARPHLHITPGGTSQSFQYSRWRRVR